MTVSKNSITLYKQAKAGLKSLCIQTFQVSLGLIAMLVLTGGNPPGWMVSTSFFLGIGFVAWSENKRQSELEIIIQKEEVVSLAKKNKSKSYAQKNLQDADLRGANLIDVYLRGANLIDADLIGADLSGADLSGADLIGANLSGANLRGANLRGAHLWTADLSCTNLRGTDLSYANLRYAYLWITDLRGANLRGTDLSYANLIGANMSGADLSTTIVYSAIFENNKGIDEESKNDLIERGAKFNDTPGDTADIKSPVRR